MVTTAVHRSTDKCDGGGGKQQPQEQHNAPIGEKVTRFSGSCSCFIILAHVRRCRELSDRFKQIRPLHCLDSWHRRATCHRVPAIIMRLNRNRFLMIKARVVTKEESYSTQSLYTCRTQTEQWSSFWYCRCHRRIHHHHHHYDHLSNYRSL